MSKTKIVDLIDLKIRHALAELEDQKRKDIKILHEDMHRKGQINGTPSILRVQDFCSQEVKEATDLICTIIREFLMTSGEKYSEELSTKLKEKAKENFNNIGNYQERYPKRTMNGNTTLYNQYIKAEIKINNERNRGIDKINTEIELLMLALKKDKTKSKPSIHWPDTFTGKVMVIVVAGIVMLIIKQHILPIFQKADLPKQEILKKETAPSTDNNDTHSKKKDTEPHQKKEVSGKPMLTDVVPSTNNQNLRNNKFLLESNATKELFDGYLTITLTSLLNFSNSDINLSLSKKGLQAKTYAGIKIGQKIFYEGYEITFMETERNITHYDALLRIMKLDNS